MHILYVATRNEYGKPELGLSFEHNNFFDCLHRMGHTITYFDFMGLMHKYGRAGMNRRLLEVARSAKADLMFTMLLADELDQITVRKISDGGWCTTFNWYCDDHWRFDIFSKYWAPCFHWVSTTVRGGEEWYRRAGYERAIKTQWAVNPFAYRRQEVPLEHDVTFIGQPHGPRRQWVEALRGRGIAVQTWGHGWEAGRIGFGEMVKVFCGSRINLNFTASSVRQPTAGDARRRAMSNWLVKAPMGYALKTAAVWTLHALRSGRKSAPAAGIEAEAEGPVLAPQIKGRNFEVPGCGGFLLTEYAEDLESYYQPGREIVVFDGLEECAMKIKEFLADEKARAGVAQAGYDRTMKEHTYVQRFSELFKRMGLSAEAPGGLGPVEMIA